ncbi:conserved hypothetical protein [Candidatus Zixiibacteriota bacterium]|nr:conserved hypothetical protein [candidate division Zixibacteria bacterium]
MEVPFFRLRLTSAEKKEVLDVVNSGWVTTGPKARQFEAAISEITGVRYAVAVSSATAGLHLALATLDIGTGDEVITTPYTMAATVEAIIYTGARPIFVDIDPETLNIDAGKIEARISRKTKAIIPVDIAGWPCDYDHLQRISRRNKIPLVQDAAHSFGAAYRNRPVGTHADLTVFSFYSTKNITTGEGGMVVSDKKVLADRIRHLSLHGMTSSGWKRYSGGGWRYDITELGFKYNLSDLSAALGLGQLKRLGEFQKKRSTLAASYFEGLSPLLDYIELPYFDKDSSHTWHLFIIKLHPEKWKISRDRLIEELEKKGIGCGVHFIPISHFSYFRKQLNLRPSDYPESSQAFRRVISLPFYPDLKKSEVAYVCRSLTDLAKKFGR